MCNKCAISDIVQPGAKPQCGFIKAKNGARENGACVRDVEGRKTTSPLVLRADGRTCVPPSIGSSR